MTTKISSAAAQIAQLVGSIECGSAVTASQAPWRAYKTFGPGDTVPNYWTIESNDYTTNGFSISGYIHDDDVARLVLAANSHHAMKEALEAVGEWIARMPVTTEGATHQLIAIDTALRLTKEI